MFLPNKKAPYLRTLGAANPDRFLLLLFNPPFVMESLAIIDTFNEEVASIANHTTSPLMAHIKLQWWRDELQKIYMGQGVPPTPLLGEMATLIKEYALPFHLFDSDLTGRRGDVSDDPPYDLGALRTYISDTQGNLMRVKCMICGGTDPQALWDAVAHIYGVVGMVCSAPYHAAYGRIFLPEVTLAQMQPRSLELKECVQHIVQNVWDDMCSMGRLSNPYLKAHKVLTKLYCDALERVQYDPFLLYPLPFKELRVWWGVRFGRC